MFLGNLAERWVNEPLEAFDDQTMMFVPSEFVARISLVDRFLSNFNRPLRRRMFHYRPDAPIPANRTVRVKATGAVFILGQARTDSNAGEQYHEMAMAHLVTDEGPNSSAGLAQFSRHSPEGPEDNPGWVTEKPNGVGWCDTEFRTSLNEPDLVDERIETFIAWFSSASDIAVHDMINLHNRLYRVTDTYADSGLLMARLDRRETYYIDALVTVKNGTRYDTELRRYVADEQVYQVSVTLNADHDYVTWSTESDDTIMLSIDQEHIGFRPRPGMTVTFEDRERVIRQVSYYRGERQYKVRCR